MNDLDPSAGKDSEPSPHNLELLAMAIGSVAFTHSASQLDIVRSSEEREGDKQKATLPVAAADIVSSFYPNGLRGLIVQDSEHAPYLEASVSNIDKDIIKVEIGFRTVVFTDENEIYSDIRYIISRGNNREFKFKKQITTSSKLAHKSHRGYIVRPDNDGSTTVEHAEAELDTEYEPTSEDVANIRALMSVL